MKLHQRRIVAWLVGRDGIESDIEMAAVREERIAHKKITGMIRFLIKTLRFYGNGLNPFHGRAAVVVSRKTARSCLNSIHHLLAVERATARNKDV